MQAHERLGFRRRFPFFQTIRFRFGLWVAALVVLVLAALAITVYVSLSKKLYQMLDDSLKLSASEAVAAMDIEDGRIVLTNGSIDEIAAALRAKGYSLRLVDETSGKILSYGELPISTQTQDLSRLGIGTEPDFEVVRGAAGLRLRVYTTTVKEQGKIIGILQIGKSIAQTTDTLNDLILTLIIAGPALALFGGAGASYLVARALAPIDRMTKTARSMTAENLSDRLHIAATDDEVGRLAATFDEMTARLADSFRRERQFSSDLSHELRTPLAAMETIITVTLGRKRSNGEYAKALEDLRSEVTRLKSLTEEMLVLTRLGTMEPKQQRAVDLSTLVPYVIESLRPFAVAKGLRIRVQCEASQVIKGDEDRLIRLVVNIVDNAIKFTEKGEIRVEVCHDDGGVCLSVKDTGCGIAGEHLERVFDRLYRADSSRHIPGSGLGLSIAKQIAISMDGSIAVTSELNRGSCFTVRFPSAKPVVGA